MAVKGNVDIIKPQQHGYLWWKTYDLPRFENISQQLEEEGVPAAYFEYYSKHPRQLQEFDEKDQATILGGADLANNKEHIKLLKNLVKKYPVFKKVLVNVEKLTADSTEQVRPNEGAAEQKDKPQEQTASKNQFTVQNLFDQEEENLLRYLKGMYLEGKNDDDVRREHPKSKIKQINKKLEDLRFLLEVAPIDAFLQNKARTDRDVALMVFKNPSLLAQGKTEQRRAILDIYGKYRGDLELAIIAIEQGVLEIEPLDDEGIENTEYIDAQAELRGLKAKKPNLKPFLYDTQDEEQKQDVEGHRHIRENVLFLTERSKAAREYIALVTHCVKHLSREQLAFIATTYPQIKQQQAKAKATAPAAATTGEVKASAPVTKAATVPVPHYESTALADYLIEHPQSIQKAVAEDPRDILPIARLGGVDGSEGQLNFTNQIIRAGALADPNTNKENPTAFSILTNHVFEVARTKQQELAVRAASLAEDQESAAHKKEKPKDYMLAAQEWWKKLTGFFDFLPFFTSPVKQLAKYIKDAIKKLSPADQRRGEQHIIRRVFGAGSYVVNTVDLAKSDVLKLLNTANPSRDICYEVVNNAKLFEMVKKKYSSEALKRELYAKHPVFFVKLNSIGEGFEKVVITPELLMKLMLRREGSVNKFPITKVMSTEFYNHYVGENTSVLTKDTALFSGMIAMATPAELRQMVLDLGSPMAERLAKDPALLEKAFPKDLNFDDEVVVRAIEQLRKIEVINAHLVVLLKILTKGELEELVSKHPQIVEVVCANKELKNKVIPPEDESRIAIAKSLGEAKAVEQRQFEISLFQAEVQELLEAGEQKTIPAQAVSGEVKAGETKESPSINKLAHNLLQRYANETNFIEYLIANRLDFSDQNVKAEQWLIKLWALGKESIRKQLAIKIGKQVNRVSSFLASEKTELKALAVLACKNDLSLLVNLTIQRKLFVEENAQQLAVLWAAEANDHHAEKPIRAKLIDAVINNKDRLILLGKQATPALQEFANAAARLSNPGLVAQLLDEITDPNISKLLADLCDVEAKSQRHAVTEAITALVMKNENKFVLLAQQNHPSLQGLVKNVLDMKPHLFLIFLNNVSEPNILKLHGDRIFQKAASLKPESVIMAQRIMIMPQNIPDISILKNAAIKAIAFVGLNPAIILDALENWSQDEVNKHIELLWKIIEGHQKFFADKLADNPKCLTALKQAAQNKSAVKVEVERFIQKNPILGALADVTHVEPHTPSGEQKTANIVLPAPLQSPQAPAISGAVVPAVIAHAVTAHAAVRTVQEETPPVAPPRDAGPVAPHAAVPLAPPPQAPVPAAPALDSPPAVPTPGAAGVPEAPPMDAPALVVNAAATAQTPVSPALSRLGRVAQPTGSADQPSVKEAKHPDTGDLLSAIRRGTQLRKVEHDAQGRPVNSRHARGGSSTATRASRPVDLQAALRSQLEQRVGRHVQDDKDDRKPKPTRQQPPQRQTLSDFVAAKAAKASQDLAPSAEANGDWSTDDRPKPADKAGTHAVQPAGKTVPAARKPPTLGSHPPVPAAAAPANRPA